MLTLPNPDLFVFMYVRKEAVLSSQIEGTQSSLQDLLAAEAQLFERNLPGDSAAFYDVLETNDAHGRRRQASMSRPRLNAAAYPSPFAAGVSRSCDPPPR